MPGLDRTGPAGMGPMTGGARGLCNPSSPLYGNYARYRYPYQAPRAYLERPRWGMGRGYGGRGAFGVFQTSGVQVYLFEGGTVREAVEAYEAG